MDDWSDEPPRPQRWGRAERPVGTVVAAVHGAHHVLTRRLTLEVRDHALGPTEVVLTFLQLQSDVTISVVGHGTGLRPSTLDSLLDRLATRAVCSTGWVVAPSAARSRSC